MKRMTSVTTATAMLAAAAMLSACNQQDQSAPVSTGSATQSNPSGSTASATRSGPHSSSDTGSAAPTESFTADDGPASASRAGTLTDDGGWYAKGHTITFVYNNGIRFSIDTGGPIPDLQHLMSTSPKGKLTLTPTQATWLSADGKPSSVDASGAGLINESSGTIGVLPDGSVTCANKHGLQFVGSDGTKGKADKSGLFYVDKTGKTTVVGSKPEGGKLAGRYVVCNVGDTSTVDLNADVLFSYGSAALTATGKQVVDQTAKSITSHVDGKTVAVAGNTDSKGSNAFNKKLGLKRANAVAAQLRKDLPGVQLKVSSNGESKPIAANTTPDGSDNPTGRAKNRRVTISWANE